jgi:hypothetical protein
MNEDKQQLIAQLITSLNDKYKDEPYMLQRIDIHLKNLPVILEQEKRKYNERVCRFNELTMEHENFHKVFLSKYQYFYSPHNNNYYEYDGKTYSMISEDYIYYNLLSTISNEGKLTQWKYKTKQTIIKKIKERNLFKSMPESYTIQTVLNFLQSFFNSNADTKYFLSVIGDCILKKNTDSLLYFVSSNLKTLINSIDIIMNNVSGFGVTNNFITKYHETHNLQQYRLIKSNESRQISSELMNDTLKHIGLDLICVATHYSDRYGNSDACLTIEPECSKDYVLYFTNNSIESIIESFISECIQVVSSDTNSLLTKKDMIRIWKIYLSNLDIPSVIYSQQLQEILMSKLEHNGNIENTIFTNVTSKYLPVVSSFLSFWDSHIQITQNPFDEYEIDELYKMCKITLTDKKMPQSSIIKIITNCFSPSVEIVDGKYVKGITCDLWNKKDDINEFLRSFIETNKNDNKKDIISFDELYQSYQSYFKAKRTVEQVNYMIVSKNYFETFIQKELTQHIIFDKFVSSMFFDEL